MTPEQIQQKIFFGYAKAAYKLGASFNLYRSTVPLDPIDPDNLIGVVQMTTSVSWDYMKASKYGNSVFNACLDAQSSSAPLNCTVGDYLVPFDGSEDQRTYFVQSLQFDLPPQVVQCNRTIGVIRPSQDTGAGFIGYAGYTPSESETVMTGMPASVLKEGRGESAPSKLPTDGRQPTWTIYLPNLGGVILRVGDIVIDELEQNYQIYSNELSDLGWRLSATQVLNTR